MCELMAIAATAFFAVLYFCSGRRDRAALTTALAFAGAALMWAVDCAVCAMDGEPLLDMSREDAILGAIVLAAGAAFYAVARILRPPHA